MILYNPQIGLHGWDRDTNSPLINVEGETRTAVLEPILACSLVFSDVAQLLEFSKQVTELAKQFTEA